MTSRERLLQAINHTEPDRVPIDLNGTMVTALTRVAYNNLRSFLNLPADEDISMSHFAMDTVRAKDDLLDRYDIDTRTIGLNGPDNPKDYYLETGNYVDEYGHEWRQSSYYWDVVTHPFAGKTAEQIDTLVWPDERDPGRYRDLRQKAKNLRDSTDKAIVFDIPGLGPFEGACFLRNYDEFCADLHGDPVYAEKVLDKVTDSIIIIWEHILDEVGDLVDVVAQGDDVGMQTSPWMSVDMYVKFIKPRKKRIFDAIKKKSDAKIFYHSCGAVAPLIPHFIEEGIDILNPVQRSAAGMEIAGLKNDFGDAVCFWGGGIDVQQELPFLSPSEIRDEIHRTVDIMMPGGGFVFFPSHNIQADVPPENIDAMYKAVKEYGSY